MILNSAEPPGLGSRNTHYRAARIIEFPGECLDECFSSRFTAGVRAYTGRSPTYMCVCVCVCTYRGREETARLKRSDRPPRIFHSSKGTLPFSPCRVLVAAREESNVTLQIYRVRSKIALVDVKPRRMFVMLSRKQ